MISDRGNMQSVILNAAERSEKSKSAANKRFFAWALIYESFVKWL
jgi:hypothetical protein